MRLRSTIVLLTLAIGGAAAAGTPQAGSAPPPPKPPASKPDASKPAAPKPAAPKPIANGNKSAPPAPPGGAPNPALPSVSAPPDYLIGPDDVLIVVFWREKDMSGEVAVRPDGHISLPLVNDVQAAGLTPEQLRVNLAEAASKYIEDPNVTVVVKAINSRKVFITGQVAKPGPYPLAGPMTVLQLITTAGGLQEYAKPDDIAILRTVNGKPTRIRFNYKDVMRGKNLAQNIELKPGDQIVVP